MFLVGSYDHTMDNGGRMIIPSKIRDAIGERFVLCLDMSNPTQLEGMEEAAFTLKSKMVKRLGAENPEAMQMFFEYSAPITVDKQGRTLIPEKLRKKAGLGTEIVIIGMIDKFIIKNNVADKEPDNETMRAFNSNVLKLVNEELEREEAAQAGR